jgi:hypothetical protein
LIAAFGKDTHQPLLLQANERFVDRRPAHAEAERNLLLGALKPGCERVVANGVLEAAVGIGHERLRLRVDVLGPFGQGVHGALPLVWRI